MKKPPSVTVNGVPYRWPDRPLVVSTVQACVKIDDTIPGVEEGLNAGMWTSGRSASAPAHAWGNAVHTM
jgi:hypothetical protein